jgi:methylenetetrahydrofolate dehydrogenase (NADP+) / methenyltetrahydrofolate cyclohydrolase
MMALIIDGKAVAREVQKHVKEEVEGLERRWGIAPGLAVVLVGDDPGSHIYVKNKEKACKEVGIKSYEHLLPATISERELLGLIHNLNKDKNVNGILVQLPLPAHIRPERILEAISPHKDVDGFHPVNQGTLLLGGDGFRPCTPMGIIKLLESVSCDPKGKNAVVVGRSNIVGKPVALMLLEKHATVTLCHSRTANLRDEVGRGDILIVAIGKAGLVAASFQETSSLKPPRSARRRLRRCPVELVR